eukprot:TRINITY_DN10922_c0_g1_i1.p1 TRINITY_DN10922_c0_g1~~TRINITY_DN10922_c0_g1_i1.p1  ORF type:complete len:670 (-),score=210.50 TRINITY_DN10922_c0_g1_i1:271-2280(-)
MADDGWDAAAADADAAAAAPTATEASADGAPTGAADEGGQGEKCLNPDCANMLKPNSKFCRKCGWKREHVTSGLNKKDISSAMAERAEWIKSLGDGGFVEDEEWEDGASSTDESDTKSEAPVGEAPTSPSAADAEGARLTLLKKPSSLAVANKANNGTVDTAALNFEEATVKFSGKRPKKSRQKAASTEGASAEGQTEADAAEGENAGDVDATPVDPAWRQLELRRRVPQLRMQIEALSSWTDTRRTAAATKGLAVASDEALQLAKQTNELLVVMQQAMGTADPRFFEASPCRSWLPAPENPDMRAVRQLVGMQRHIADSEAHDSTKGQEGWKKHAPKTKDTAKGDDQICNELSYQVTAKTTTKGGWLQNEEAERVTSLEGRVQRLQELLGKEEGWKQASKADSLNAAAIGLEKKLNVLTKAFDPDAFDQLQATVNLLTCELDVAGAEVERLEAFEADESAFEGSSGLGAGNDVLDDMPPQRINALHQELAGLDGVVSRVAAVDRQLAAQEHLFLEFAAFQRDLAGAEARVAQTTELLNATLSATSVMKTSMETGKERVLKNVAILEAKLKAREEKLGIQIQNDKMKDEKSKDVKSKDEKSKDGKSKDDKAKDDKPKDDKPKDDKPKDDKPKDDKAQDDKAQDDKAQDVKTQDDKAQDDKAPEDKPKDG